MLARHPRPVRRRGPLTDTPTGRQSMATSTQAGNLSSSIGQAIAAAKDNPQIKKMIEDQLDTRKLMMKAAKTGGKAYMGRRAVRKAAAKGQANEGQPEGDAPRGKRRRRGGKGKIVFLALVIGVAGALANKSSREKILDLLFGAEEEFVYTSTTTTASVNGAS
jgi:hypothetical protein